METAGKYRKTGSYVSTVLETEEGEPLTWQPQENFTDVVSRASEPPLQMKTLNGKHTRFVKRKAKVKVVYVSCDDGSSNQHRHIHSASCLQCRKSRKPEVVIVFIAFIFLAVLLSVMLASLYFELKRKDGTTEPSNPVSSLPDLASTTVTAPETQTTYITVPTTQASSLKEETSLVFTTSETETTTYLGDETTALSPTSASSTASSTEVTSPQPTASSTTCSSAVTTLDVTTRQTEDTTISTSTPEITTDYGQFTTIIERTPRNLPIFYMSGPFTFREAEEACEREGTILAMKEDLKRAWRAGYNRCTFGWLRDMHVAMVMQEDYASMDCDKGGVGVLYKPAKEPLEKYSGAYCAKELSGDEYSAVSIASNANATVNWWVTADPTDAFNLRHALTSVTSKDDVTKYPLMTSLKSIYTCCNAFNLTYTNEQEPRTTIVKKFSDSYLREVVNFYRRELAPVRVLTHVTAKYDAMIKYGSATTNRSETIASLVSMAKEVGLDGIIMDYEPRENYTRGHAIDYAIFLDDLNAAMKSHNLALGTVISSWGILKFYDIYGNTNVDFIGSMGSTYYGHNVEDNKENVLGMLSSIDAERLQIGLGLMHSENVVTKRKRDYRWDEKNLRDFLSWNKQQGVTQVHVYPGQWRAHRSSEEFFLQTLADFASV